MRPFTTLRFSLALGGLVFSLLTSAAQAEEKTITDINGREVTVDLPAKQVFLGFYYTDYLAIGGIESFDNVVGFSRDVWEVWTPASWEMYRAALPQLNDIADVGEVEAGTFSIEKLLALEPDVAILADWQYQALGPDADRIEEAGIPIVVVDYNAQTLERHLGSTRILGEITGQQDRAQQIADEYKQTVDLVNERLATAKREKPRIYVEFGNKGPSEYSFTYGKNMWGAVASLAGGDNIATPFVEWWGPMNPEQVLAAKPEVIILAGRETELKKNDDALVMGVNIDRAEAKRRLAGFANRPGWQELPAIQNGRLHAVYQGASRSISDRAMIQFFAQALYPDLFADFDPDQTYLEFHRKYLPVEPTGTFTLSLDDNPAS